MNKLLILFAAAAMAAVMVVGFAHAAAPRDAILYVGEVLKKLEPVNPPSYPQEFFSPPISEGEKGGREKLTDDVAAAVRIMSTPSSTTADYCPPIVDILNLATLTNTYFEIGRTSNPALEEFVADWVQVQELAGCADTTPPTTTAQASPSPNASSWNQGDVTVELAAVDDLAGSGVKEISYTLSGAQTGGALVAGASASVAIFAEGVTAVTYFARDNIGNAEGARTLTVRIDETAPNAPLPVADRAPEFGVWYRDAVTVSFTPNGDPMLADGTPGSGVDPATIPAPQTVGSSGVHTITGSVDDLAGNQSASGSLTVHVDATPPSLTLDCPSAPVPLGGSASATWTAADGESGLATPESGAVALAANTVGITTAVAPDAVDDVGHRTGASCSFNVVYDFQGFFSPVDNLPALNAVKAGGAVPVKFGVGGDQGLGIVAPGYPISQPIACDASAPVDPVEETVTAGSSSLNYDSAADQYTYVWKTDTAWSGNCRRFVLRLDDGTMHVANFQLK